MRRQSLFQFIDILLILVALILFLAGISGLERSYFIGIVIILSAVVLLIYYGLMLSIRVRINKYLDQEEKAIESLETQEDKINQAFTNSKGEILELMIENKLNELFPEAKIYRNVYVPKSYGKDTQIDVLMLESFGIFIIEAKNLTATISGDWSKEKLKVKYRNGKEYDYDNPVLQNSMHYTYLQAISSLSSLYFFNIVVGGDKTRFENEDLKTLPSYGNLTNIKNLEKTINILRKKRKLNISKMELESFIQIIEKRMIKCDS
jgi:hypothetical protein